MKSVGKTGFESGRSVLDGCCLFLAVLVEENQPDMTERRPVNNMCQQLFSNKPTGVTGYSNQDIANSYTEPLFID